MRATRNKGRSFFYSPVPSSIPTNFFPLVIIPQYIGTRVQVILFIYTRKCIFYIFFNLYVYVCMYVYTCTVKLILSVAPHCQRFVLFSKQQAAFQSVSERVSCTWSRFNFDGGKRETRFIFISAFSFLNLYSNNNFCNEIIQWYFLYFLVAHRVILLLRRIDHSTIRLFNQLSCAMRRRFVCIYICIIYTYINFVKW